MTLLDELYSSQVISDFICRRVENIDLTFFDVISFNENFWKQAAPYFEDAMSNISNKSYKTQALLKHPNDVSQAFFLDQPTHQLQNLQNIYHYSVPTTKLFYPEPFIATASFMHSDLWFVHILVYQYWLWFVFIFIIVFFIITFLCIVRWCNMRVRPRRETRRVSRSKCGDLITAIVPVSWAASIIISESTDAIDYFDGFGTTEMVVGIRTYQWGWEYYYPKDIDLNYNVKKSYSSFFSKSLKYSPTSETNLSSNKAWKFYQNKPYDFVVTPAHLLLLPTDNFKILNYLNFSDVGTNAFHEPTLFNNTRMFSKTNFSNLLFSQNSFASKFKTPTPLFVSAFKPHTFNRLTFPWLSNGTQTSLNFNEISFSFWKKFIYVSLLEKLNNDSDKKTIKKTLKKLLPNVPKHTKFILISSFTTNNLFNNNLVSTNSFVEHFFNKVKPTQKFFIPFSANQFVHKNNQTPKNCANLSVRRGKLNLIPSLFGVLWLLTRGKEPAQVAECMGNACTKSYSSPDNNTDEANDNNRLFYTAPISSYHNNTPNQLLEAHLNRDVASIAGTLVAANVSNAIISTPVDTVPANLGGIIGLTKVAHDRINDNYTDRVSGLREETKKDDK